MKRLLRQSFFCIKLNGTIKTKVFYTKKSKKKKGGQTVFFLFYEDKPPHIMKQMIAFLPASLQTVLSHVNMQKVYELRLRAEKPLYVNYDGEYRMLGKQGFTDKVERAYTVRMDEIEDTVYKAGDFSVYSIEEQIKQGFITTDKGVRIGLAGRFIFEKGQPMTVRDVTSLCVRIPHDIKGVGETVYEKCFLSGIHNSVLLMALPGRGKTTALREICRLLCERTKKNVLLCDERGELSFGECGATCDILSFADKKTAFEVGIRTLRPDVIVTDELCEEDVSAIKRAISSGVSVLASAHVADENKAKNTYGALFDRYVLFKQDRIGSIDRIFDGEWKEIR